eukprot:CAMPEP_0171124192 /NCGR_PEP_ID=MMETSP0766_2-20121228/108710_1 /TAXON_ID=439317 /ORGANISM="Gambierdiscus australes, Strain CAWD 149" /LENGTH=77 /DNA_ID=CAMNT_0011587099 /DNA_START=12 /DNA_END=242 /DNA_ORIENTATION=+
MAMLGAEMTKPTPVAPRWAPIVAANTGITGTIWLMPMLSISWLPDKMATSFTSLRSMAAAFSPVPTFSAGAFSPGSR